MISILIFSLLYLFSFSGSLRAQRPVDDSLKYLLQLQYDSTLVIKLIDKAKDSFDNNTETAFRYIETAIFIADSINDNHGLAKANITKGKLLYFDNNYELATEYFLKVLPFYKDSPKKLLILYRYISSSYYANCSYSNALLFSKKGYEISKELNDPNQQISFLITNSSCHNSIGEYSTALEELYIASDLAESQNLIEKKANVYLSFGSLFDYQKEYQKAIDSYNKALDIFSQLGDSSGISSANNNLGTVYSNLGQYEKSFLYYFEALQIDIEMDNTYGIAIEYNNIGDNYRELNRFELAEEYYDKSLKMAEDIYELELISTLNYNLALIYNSQNKNALALQYILKSLKIAKQINNVHELLDALKLSSRVFSDIGDYKQAFKYSSEYHQLYDSLLNETKAMEILDLQAKYENKQKDERIQKLLEKDKYQQTIRKYLVIILVIGLLLFILLIIIFYVHRTSAAKIRKQKDYFDTLLKHSQDFIAVIDNDARILYLSPSYEQKFGRTVNERMYQSAYEYIHPDDVDIMRLQIEEIKTTEKPISLEFRFKDGFGHWINMAAHGMNLLKNDNINGIIINFWDITTRKEYEEELKKTNETKNKLFSIISHDLRGFVGVSKSVVDYILEEKEDITKDEIMELLTPTKKSNESLVLLLDNLLTWAKSQLETISYNPKNYRLLPLIDENIKIFQRIFDEKSISINVNEEKNFRAYFDKEQVNFIVRNLLQNAIKYSFENSEISIEIDNQNGHIQCAIHDSGTGMSKEKKNCLFQNSFPVSMPGTNSEKGSGLGLMLCKDFTENNNGKIWVESQPGKGSSFYFTLPVNPPVDTQ